MSHVLSLISLQHPLAECRVADQPGGWTIIRLDWFLAARRTALQDHLPFSDLRVTPFHSVFLCDSSFCSHKKEPKKTWQKELAPPAASLGQLFVSMEWFIWRFARQIQRLFENHNLQRMFEIRWCGIAEFSGLHPIKWYAPLILQRLAPIRKFYPV